MLPLNPEFDLLLHSTRPRPTFSISQFVVENISWRALTEAADWHGVAPMLTHFLSSVGGEIIPSTILPDLIQDAERKARRNLILALETVRLVDSFREMRIPVITFKGPVLAQSLYGDLTRRECLDIDIIVPQTALDRAAGVMQSWGYRSTYQERDRREYGSAVGQYLFIHPSTKLKVDLHWTLAPFDIPFPFPEAEIWKTPAEVEIAGRRVPTMDIEHLAMFLAFHGAKERWTRLKWISDFARVVETGQLDWQDLLHRMTSAHCRRQLLLAVLVTADLYELETDRNLLNEARSQPTVRRLAHDSISRLGSRNAETQLTKFTYAFSVIDRKRDRLTYCAALATTRTVSDYRSLPLPGGIDWFYYFVRPFRLVAKAARLVTIRVWARLCSSIHGWAVRRRTG